MALVALRQRFSNSGAGMVDFSALSQSDRPTMGRADDQCVRKDRWSAHRWKANVGPHPPVDHFDSGWKSAGGPAFWSLHRFLPSTNFSISKSNFDASTKHF